MKKIFLFAAIAALSSCNSDSEKKEDATGSMSSDSTKGNDVAYAYPVQYTNLEMGDARHAQTVLNIWKAWDSGDLSGMKDAFADSLVLNFWDGSSIKGSRDSALSAIQAFRNTFSSISSSINAVMSVKAKNSSNNQMENVALVWGKEVSITKKGKSDSIWLHEVWQINKDGKVDLVNQFASLIPKPQPAKLNK